MCSGPEAADLCKGHEVVEGLYVPCRVVVDECSECHGMTDGWRKTLLVDL